MKSFESGIFGKNILPNNKDLEQRDHPMTEDEAEEKLEALLKRPENKFLTEIEQNRTRVEDSASAIDALTYAEGKIRERSKRTLDLLVVSEADGVEIKDVSLEGLQKNIESILTNAEEIGKGGDAFVVVDKSEIKGLPPEICYKFAIKEQTPRGRNTCAREVEFQEKFFSALLHECPESKIGVPIPFYSLEVGVHKVIAMEKLNAKSVDDILRGKGFLPAWVDVEELCTELKKALDFLHAKGLYHRDMHLGNIMISQNQTRPENEKIGYLIDFGLSAENTTGIDVYKSSRAGELFTYNDDYGIMNYLKKVLSALKKRI